MSSNDKRDLTTKANDGEVSSGKGKAASATVIGDVVTLPPDADDVIFTTLCDSSLNGVVDAELEMSYDKENWCPAVTEEFTAGSSVTGWGNQKYIDTVPTSGASEYKNKHAKGTLAFDTSGNEVGTATGTRDVLYNFMQKDKPFNVNWWHKSETVPNTVVTTPAVLGVEKAIHTKNSAGYGTTAVEPCGANQLTPTSTWSISYWVRADASANAYHVHLADTGLNVRMGVHNGTSFKLTLGSHGLNYTSGSHPTIFANDTDWHHIVVTCDGQSASTTNYTHGSVNSNHKVYIDGAFIDRTHVSLTSDYTNTNAFKVNSNSFAGSWTDISFWNVDLSSDKDSITGASQKIQSLYNSGVPTDLTGESGLVTWYRCGDNASDTILTIVNNATSYSNDGMTLTGFNNTTNGEIVDIGSGESVYQAFVPAVTANNYNPIIFRQGNKDPFANEKYLNLSKGTGEDKNKYLSAPTNITYDTFTKCLEVSDSTDGGAFLEIQNTCGSGSSDFHDGNAAYSVTPTKSWTMSFWYKSPSNAVPYSTSTRRYMAFFGAHWGLWLDTNGDFDLKNTYVNTKMIMPTGINLFDGNWHHVTFTWRHDPGGSTTITDYKTAANNATDPGSSLFIDGQPCTTTERTTYHTMPPHSFYDMGIAGANPNWSIGYGSVPGRYAHLAIETGAQVASDALARYNSGTPTDLSSTVPIYLNFENDSTGSISSSTNLDEQGTGHSSSGTPDSDYPSVVHGNIFSIATLSNTTMKAQITRDIFDSKMGATSPFTINTWFNSSHNPTNWTTSTTSTFTNYKFIQGYSNHGTNTGVLRRPSSPGSLTGRNATAHDFMATSGGGFSASGWFRSPSDPYAGTGWAGTQQISGSMFYFGGDNWADRLYLYVDTTNNRIALGCEEGNARTFNFKWGDTSTWSLDNTWRHIVLTYDGTFTTNSTSTSASFKVYVDGVEQTLDTTNSTNHSLPYSDPSYAGPTDGVMDSNTNEYALLISSRMDKDSITFWNKTLNQDDIDAIYGNGKITDITQHDVSGGANYTNDCWCHYTCGDDPNDAQGDGSTDTYVLGTNSLVDVKNGNNLRFVDSYSMRQRISTYATDDPQYQAPVTTYTDQYLPVLFNNGGTDGSNFGNGLTASFTKKLGSGTTWNSAGTETTKLLLSFDGFEDGADAFNAYDASSLLDGNWHNLQLTWDGSSTNTEDVKVFADGVELSISDSGNNKLNKTAADKHFKYTAGTFVPGTFGASGWKETASTDSIHAFQGSLDNLSLHSEVTTLAKAQEFYGKGGNLEGKPHNYQMSNTLNYSNVEGWWTFDEPGDSITVANDRTSNNIDLTLNNFVSGGNGLVAMSNSDSIYLVNPIKGEGFTVSITKNLKDDGTWVESQDQTARLILSFNGFESAAQYWVAYNVNQTGLTPAVNLLDGLWHSVTISYAGTTDNSGNALGTDEIRFGPTQVSGVDQPFHFQVAFDGQVLEAVNSGKGYDLAKGGASGVDANAGFVIENKHLRHENSVATYIPTTYLASGIAETAGNDSIYAFQGGFDESSFHSDSWWVTSTDYNQEKPLTIFGISSALSNPIRRAPYNLRAPSEIEVDAATTPNQYIDPNPTSSTNTNGGMEVYYRWGDTTGDCSQSIRDVRSHETAPASLNRDIVAYNIVHEDAVILDTDASESTTYAKDLTYNTSGTYKMYVAQSTETTLGGLSTNAVKVSGCAPNTCQQQGVLSAKLPHMRVKWTGGGSCDLGEDKCRAQLWFRRRKK